MNRRVAIAASHIPPYHRWFATEVCRNDPLVYLANRRLLETTLHATPTAWAPRMTKAPTMSGAFDAWTGSAPAGAFVLNGAHARTNVPAAHTAFRAAQYKQSLYVAVRCEDPSGIAKMPGPRHAVFNGSNLDALPRLSDYVCVMIDAKHEHKAAWQFFVTPSGGKLTATTEYATAIRPVNPLCRRTRVEEESPDVTARWEAHVCLDKDRLGWTAFLRIPWTLFGVGRAPVVGFNICRFKHSMFPEQSAWSDVRWMGENFGAPLRMGDLYLNDSPVTVRNLWLGSGFAGRSRLVLEAVNHGTKPLKVAWRVAFKQGKRIGRKVSDHTTALKPGANLIAQAYPNEGGAMILQAFVGRSAAPAYRASYEITGFPSMGGADAAYPSKSATAYEKMKTAWLASRLPRMIRVTTADGAPSDFCFADTKGRVAFDLMKPGVVRRIARMIESRFNDTDDRLAAVPVFVCQPDVMVYEESVQDFDHQHNSLSIMRIGVGICGAFVTMMTDIVEAMRPPEGGRYRAYRCGISQMHVRQGRLKSHWAHCQLLVTIPGGRQVMLNPFAYRPRDRRLAGPDDVAEFTRVAGWRYNRNELMPIQSGSRAWPEGAPLA